MFRAAAFGQSKFPSRDLDNDRDEVLGPIQLEVIDLDRYGEFRDRVLEHQSIFKLAFFVGGGEFAELLAGEVALAILQAGRYVRIQRDLNAAEFSVESRVAAVITNDVVARDGLLGLHDP